MLYTEKADMHKNAFEYSRREWVFGGTRNAYQIYTTLSENPYPFICIQANFLKDINQTNQ